MLALKMLLMVAGALMLLVGAGFRCLRFGCVCNWRATKLPRRELAKKPN